VKVEKDVEPEPVVEVEPEPEKQVIQALNYNEYDTKIVRQTLRSGMGVQYDGNIVVIGDVNPGAELSAGGHVIVMGKLRGMVHAGKFGNRDAYVIASKLLPTQIRISNVIARAPEGENIDELRPEIAHLKSGKMSIEEL
jgi:septum site-determining protein MinC